MQNEVMKMRPEHKAQIQALVESEIKRLGSQNAVAVKCGVSPATIDGIRKNTYNAKGDDMWFKVGKMLGWNPEHWLLADVGSTRIVKQVLKDARNKSMFIPISYKAGSGKTAAIQSFLAENPKNVFYILCREWNKREFFLELCRILGVDPSPGYPVGLLLEKIIDFFRRRSDRPLLIIDQANSLQPSVLTFLIHLYNACEDMLGVVMVGTEELKKTIKKGVHKQTKGYDEIDSRFGRNYVELFGCTLADTRKICAANGVTDEEVQLQIFKECSPVPKRIGSESTRTVDVVEDLRRLKRLVLNQQLKQEAA